MIEPSGDLTSDASDNCGTAKIHQNPGIDA